MYLFFVHSFFSWEMRGGEIVLFLSVAIFATSYN